MKDYIPDNDMAEAVQNPKRDYRRASLKPNAASVLRQLDGWFEHHNTVHSHIALGYRSPCEFGRRMGRGDDRNRHRRRFECTVSAGCGERRNRRRRARSASLDASAAVDHP